MRTALAWLTALNLASCVLLTVIAATGPPAGTRIDYAGAAAISLVAAALTAAQLVKT